MTDIAPKYEIEKVEKAVVNQKVIRYVKEKDANGKFVTDENGKVVQSRVETLEDVAKGKTVYDVYFAQGHHIQFVGDEALKEANLDGNAKLVDMDTGEDVPEAFMSLKQRSLSKTHAPRRAK